MQHIVRVVVSVALNLLGCLGGDYPEGLREYMQVIEGWEQIEEEVVAEMVR